MGEPLPPSDPPPGWHTDPTDPDHERWWDGTAWTDHRRVREQEPSGSRSTRTRGIGRASTFTQVLLALLVVGVIIGLGALYLSGTADPVLNSVGLPTHGYCYTEHHSGEDVCTDEAPYCFHHPATGEYICQADEPSPGLYDVSRDPP